MKPFKIIACDTDSIFFKNHDDTDFTEEESEALLKELNALFPERIHWSHNGSFDTVITFKAKNYVMRTKTGKVTLKGSAVRSSGKEKALQEYIKETIQAILDDTGNYVDIYHRYVKEINDLKDIKRWSSRKTISERTLKSERTNETKIMDAIKGTEYGEGNRVWVYFKSDNNLALAEHFNGDYNRAVLLKKLYNTSQLFETVLGEGVFLNYSLKRNKTILEAL